MNHTKNRNTTKTTKNTKTTTKRGRPKSKANPDPEIEWEMERIEIFGKLHSTYEEMADHFECSTRTIERYMSDEESNFCRAYKKGLSQYKQKLRSEQRKLAFSGNATMLIWLGKQDLDQTDKHHNDVNHTGSVGIIDSVIMEPATEQSKNQSKK